MTWVPTRYEVEVVQALDASLLALLSEAEAEEAEDSGALAGNRMYQDLRGFTCADLAEVLARERAVIHLLTGAADLEAEAELYEEERSDAFDPSEALWHLDLGVAAATVALSVLGATPVGSCNAGGFGGFHQAAHPYVAFYLPPEDADMLHALVRDADVGLRVDSAGLAQIYAKGDLDLLRFAEHIFAQLCDSNSTRHVVPCAAGEEHIPHPLAARVDQGPR